MSSVTEDELELIRHREKLRKSAATDEINRLRSHNRKLKRQATGILYSAIGFVLVAGSLLVLNSWLFKENTTQVSTEILIVPDEQAEAVLVNYTEIPPQDSNLIFAIQLGAFRNRISTFPNFDNNDIEQLWDGKYYLYYTGNYATIAEAENFAFQLRQNGHKGAFVIPIYKSQKISWEEANVILRKTTFN
ncbi:SPOR domain-containing protein [Prolixibacteraceae bacterium Z1-6]|uniref:SPOR domain-containing protein n=1 Tax=Draconibacterium aestuarii TaxID=2998507 RepID=A0A9X3FBK3_9BACT|nr:SPOR domain-containing protein [Prolixibacteraceae bacterium Z1-6]